MPRTKIVATIGPASWSSEKMRALISAGMNVARVNFSHGDRKTIEPIVARLREAARAVGKQLAILGDLQGPKLRLGIIDEREVVLGEKLILTVDGAEEGSIPFPHPELYEAIEPGARLVLGDGEVEFSVLEREGMRLVCTVTVEGVIGSRKGLNLPGTVLPIPSITEKDRQDLEAICDLGLDFVALSFVRSAEDVHELRGLMRQRGCRIPIIAKIELGEAIVALDEIVAAADGLMVARGDLGIDLPAFEVPKWQKLIIRKCNTIGKPVITATQMLQSMVTNPTPTRAEATDVANAILDGTDAVMLSAETASGNFPVKSVMMMCNLARITEQHFPYDDWNRRRREQLGSSDSIADGISSASCALAGYLNARAIVTTTVSGYTAHQVARYRPEMPIIALSPKEETCRRLNLVWGVRSQHAPQFETMDEMIEETASLVAQAGNYSVGDRIVITAGVPFGRTGLTNLLQVHEFTVEDFD